MNTKIKKTYLLRISSAAVTIGVAICVYILNIPNPMMNFIIPIVIFTYADGYISGMISGAISFAYSLYFFAENGQPFVYNTINSQKLVTIASGIVVIVFLIGRLKKNEKQHIHQLDSMNEKLQSFAFIDPLTNAYNRYALISHFGDPNTATGAGLSFGLMDLDFFKSINDQYGHMVGDAVLKHIVEQIWQVIPSNATVYRIGGEEFLVVLKTADKELAHGTFEKIRSQIETHRLHTDEHEIAVTVSIGCYVCARRECTVHECVTLADNHLYEAKAAGRNCVMPVCPSHCTV